MNANDDCRSLEKDAPLNPFTASAAHDEDDGALAVRAAGGDRDALARLLRRHQRWVYAIALRMVRSPDAAADLAQEALLRVVTRIAQFEGNSSFRTWAYRIVVNCLLDAKRLRAERMFTSFTQYGDALDRLPLAEPSAAENLDPERALLVEETKIGCMLGMLLCLSREQRIAYVLGTIFEAPSALAAAILDISPAAYRKQLERARIDLASFMNDKCGLVRTSNPCRCPKKTDALVREGWVDPARLQFVEPHVRAIREQAPALSRRLDVLAEDAYARLFQAHPLHNGPDFAAALTAMLVEPETREVFRLDSD